MDDLADVTNRDSSSVQSWKPPDIEEFRKAQLEFSLPKFASMNVDDEYEVVEEDISAGNVGDSVPAMPNFAPPRISQLGLTEIPDISDANLNASDLNVSFQLPPGLEPPKVPDLLPTTHDPDNDNNDNDVLGAVEGEYEFVATPKEMKSKEKNEKSNKKKPNDIQNQQEKYNKQRGASLLATAIDNVGATKASFSNKNEEQSASSPTPPHNYLATPTDDSDYSFPRQAKGPKKPKRDQSYIPKHIPTAAKKKEAPGFDGNKQPQQEEKKDDDESTTTQQDNNLHQPKSDSSVAGTPEDPENDSDIPSLLFEGISSLIPKQVEKSLRSLAQLVLHDKRKCHEAVDLGGHGILVVTLKKWPHHERIIQLCCECLHNLVYSYKAKDDNRGVDLPEALAVMGTLETIVKVMDKYTESAGVQQFGLAALGNILYGHGPQLQARATKCVEDYDAISTVVGAMRRFPKTSMVQGCGCIVLRQLYKKGDYKRRMLDAGVLMDVSAAVTHHPDLPLIEQEASAFFKLFFGWQHASSSGSTYRSTKKNK